ncbi:MAG: hypothetical protein MUC90_04635 [Thermoplasmata archaeon]|nr:hypothetical protein [Thermoplasmata archaeon]
MDLSPQCVSYSAYSSADRIKKSPRWDNDDGVAATVGTIMSLLVFITMFGIFTNQFVPVWMNDNESEHMSVVIEQFSTLKSSVDISISNTANSLIAPTPVFVPLTLSSAGIPVFAASTAGIMSFVPEGFGSRPVINVTYNYYSTATGGTGYQLNSNNDGKAGGYLELYCPNRYYVEQRIIYENGAVILNQTDGEVVLAGPQFLVKNLGTSASPNRVMMMTQITLQGLNVTVGGTGSKGVTADLFAETKALENSVDAVPQVTVEIESKHAWAWYNYFLNMLNGTAGMTLGNGFNMTRPVLMEFQNENLNYYSFTLVVDSIKVLDHTKAIVTISIGELGV